MFTDKLWLIILLLGLEERLTQTNCFLFCETYGLFNSFIFLTIKKFLLSYFPNFHGQRSGGQDLSILYQKQSCFSHGERTYTETVLLEMNCEMSD